MIGRYFAIAPVRLLFGVVLMVAGLSVPRPSLASTSIAPTSCNVVVSTGGRVLSTTPSCVLAAGVGSSTELTLASTLHWSGLRVSRPGVVATSGVVAPVSGGLHAVVWARRVGTVTVSVTGSPVCPGGQMCPDLAQLWSIRFYVVPASGSPVNVILDVHDAGRRLQLRVGDQISVHLASDAVYAWTPPRSSLKLLKLDGPPTSGSASVFRAVAPGTVVVTATGTPRCYPECLVASRLFQVTVLIRK